MTEPRRTFHWRALTPDQEDAIRAAHAKGAGAGSLAQQYGVHYRTIYRAIRRSEEPRYTVELNGWTASFRMEGGAPVQVTPWVPA